MKRGIKKGLAILLVLCMAAAGSQTGRLEVQASTVEVEEAVYDYEAAADGTVTITKCSLPETVTELSIPGELDGKTVTGIGDYAFANCSNLENIIVPDTVTSIGNDVFMNCSNLENIILSSVLTEIGIGAFSYCEKLESITIPASVTSIDQCSFWYCNVLREIRVVEGNSAFSTIDGMLFDAAGKKLIVCPSAKTSIELSSSVEDIEREAFSPYSSLVEIKVAEGNRKYKSIDGVLYDVDESTLLRCPIAKAAITLPENITSIEYDAFWNCSHLTEITIPKGIESGFKGELFMGCDSLEMIYVADGNIGYKSVEGVLYSADGTCLVKCPQKKAAVTILEGVDKIGDDAFLQCVLLEEIEIPEKVTSIGEYSFFNCSNLKNIQIPDSVDEIGGWAFLKCSNLTDV